MNLLVRVAVTVSVLTMWLVGAGAQDSLTRQDSQGPVTVTAALTAFPVDGGSVRVKISLDTHSVNLDGLSFEDVVVLRASDGTDVRPTAVEQTKGGTHHREAILVFRPVDERATIRVVVKDVGAVKERVFTWDAPAAR